MSVLKVGELTIKTGRGEQILKKKQLDSTTGQYLTLRIIPDRTVLNNRNHDFMRSIHDFYRGYRKRLKFTEKEIEFKDPTRFFWDIVMTAGDVAFYCTVPTEKESFVRQQIELTWEHATILKEAISHIEELNDLEVCEMGLSRHNIFSLKVDKRIEHEPLGSLLMGTKELKDDDFARIQIVCQPVNRLSWQDTTEKAHKKFKSGKVPRRMKISKKDALLASGDGILFAMDQASDAIDVILDSLAGKASARDKEIRDKSRKEDAIDIGKRMILIDGDLKTSTHHKKKDPTFKTWMRIIAGSKDAGRRQSIIMTLSNGYHDLTADNELERVELSRKTQLRTLSEILHFSPSAKTTLDPNAMILSNNELGRLIELPSAYLQDTFDFQSINRREVQIPNVLRSGIPWGLVSHKGTKEIVHIPIKDYGLLCRPQVVLGKMGTGKTNQGMQMGHLFPTFGFTSILMDTADGDLIQDAINRLPADFPESHIIDLDFGNLALLPASDWSEITSAMQLSGGDWTEIEVNRRMASNKLSGVLIDFLNKLATNETTDNMERFLSAVAKGILTSPTRGIMEVILCLTNGEYRENVLQNFKINDSIVFGTIQELHEMSQDTRAQTVRFIMSRINVLLSNDYMRNSILQTPNIGPDGKPLINIRKWIDGNLLTNPKYGGAYFVGIRIPKSILGETGIDRFAAFWDAKIWLAALSRYNVPSVKGCHGKPFVYIRDEPHQTPSSFKIHNDACREARKWGMKNIWMAHKLEDFEFMKKTLKDAGAQFSIFSTSKETVKSLKEELAPFTEEELFKIPEKRVCVSKFAESDEAFLCETIKSPLVKDRSYIRKQCAETYGRPLHEVEKEIFDKTRVLYSQDKPKKRPTRK
ncbi:hypothetical protein [Paenisporosarcina sp. OV554]|uniref:hypothetical protein n=1 Tax=Paenisporosarcina sp. OV554 TaxID=2135694 RepID=UPI000D375AC8|nr:hypothetical protein [Paenisporosarcina sp. OV554]PUB09600.1 hypothetical protein C8K15_1273 [Paenisporosarcina sp. OV554]